MKLAVITIAHNEEKIIPHFIHHYAKIADHIFVVDNESTDNMRKVTLNTAEKLNCSVSILSLETNGFDDHWAVKARTNLYKQLAPDFDLVIQVDTDEFIHHKIMPTREFFENKIKEGIVFFKPTGYHMVSLSYPEYEGDSILNIVREGVRDLGFDKAMIFSPKYLLTAGYGCHNSELFDNDMRSIPPFVDSSLLLLHYRFLGVEYSLNRIRTTENRLTELGKHLALNGIGGQILVDNPTTTKNFYELYNKREFII